MKNVYAAAGSALILFFGIANVQANDNGERGDRTEAQQRHDHRNEQRQQERSAAEHRAEVDARRLTAERTADQSRHPNHLSTEERRALRQQINEAGQDIYNRQR